MNHILVIEDDNHIRDEICLLLELEDFSVASAGNGLEGMNELQTKRPDLIFCDVLMPVMDGHEFVAELRADHTFAEIPLVFLSARTTPEDIQKGMQLGANAYLTKPFSVDDLLNTIGDLLGGN